MRAILRGETKPVKATWIIWVSLDCVTLAGMYGAGSVNGQILGAIAGGLSVAVLSLKYGEAGWTNLDKFCLFGAVVGIITIVTSSPVAGMLVSLGVCSLGSLPIFVSAWKDPSKENKLAWITFWMSCICALIAVPQWTIKDAGQPITFFVIETDQSWLY